MIPWVNKVSILFYSLCGLKNDVQYTHVKCASREQCNLLRGFFRKVQLLLWPTQLAVVAPTFNDAFCDVDYIEDSRFKSQCRDISRTSNQCRKIEFWFIPPTQPFGMVISKNYIKKFPSALHLKNFRKARKFTKKYHF